MKQPNYLDYCTEEIEELFGKYQDSVIKAIVKRIIKYGDVTPSTIEQLDILQESGLVYDDILNAISEYSVMAKELVSKAYNNACLECISYDNALYSKAGIDKTVNVSPAVKQIVDAAIKKTNGNLQNITMTTAEASQQKFIDACSIAEMQISTGAFDVNTAIRQAIEYAIQDGVSVKYYDEDTGEVTATRNVVSAVRTAVLTGVSQTTGEIVFQNALDMGTDIIELSAHIGARPSHAVWQGKLVCISDRKTNYLTLADIGYGEVDGYKGINCRHYGFAFIEGVSKRVYTDKELEEMAAKTVTYNGNEMSVYDANKRQRAMERKIRAEKSELVGFNESIRLAKESGNKELADDLQISFDNLSVKLKRHEAIYKDFCKQTGLPELTERLQYTGFNRSVSQKAVNSNKRVEKNLKYIENDVIIRKNNGLPKKVSLPNEILSDTINVHFESTKRLNYDIDSIVPKGATLEDVYVMAGKQTSVPIRDLKRLYKTYGYDAKDWQKKSGTVCGNNFRYVIHWYENEGIVPTDEIKLKGVGKI